MNATEILSKLKEKFAELMAAPVPTPAPEPTPDPMPVAEVKKLKDGTEVTATSFEPGGVLSIAGVPAPVGVYELEDGSSLTVGENGVISEVKEVETIDTAVEDMTKKIDQVTMAVDELKAQFEAQTKLNDLQAKIEKQSEFIKELFEAVKFLAETPTGTPDAATKVEASFNKQENKKDWAAFSAQVIS